MIFILKGPSCLWAVIFLILTQFFMLLLVNKHELVLVSGTEYEGPNLPPSLHLAKEARKEGDLGLHTIAPETRTTMCSYAKK